MKKDFDNNLPIYIQIIDEIKIMIASGNLKAGDKLPSVRDMAQEFGVNPNTMQRAFSELERENLVFAERTSGRFITNDGGVIVELRNILAEKELEKFMEYMKKIGCTEDEVIEKIKNMSRSEK
ncbi:GntR family transcriptional regulator [Tyzzerella sp. An114]|uniref:GntR family transcriptional regulator n=1 Tax=Tyzzerella sp. An114 TaxID=1965545 RepID=UPI000B448467|nr:GntR family transcriptional regulator [Tyzzerella sp. An114]